MPVNTKHFVKHVLAHSELKSTNHRFFYPAQAKELWSTCVDLCCAEDICDIQQPRPLLSSTRPPPTGADATAASAARHQEQATLDDGALTSSADGDIGVANVDAEWLEGGKERPVMAKYARFREAVASMGLERAWDMAPLIRVSEGLVSLAVSSLLVYVHAVTS